MGSRRWFSPGFSKGCSWAGREARAGPARSSVAALGHGQGDLGPGPGKARGGITQACSLRHFLGFRLSVVFFIPDDPNRNMRLSVVRGR